MEESLLAQSQRLREEEAKKAGLREEEKMQNLLAEEARLLEQVTHYLQQFYKFIYINHITSFKF